MANRLDELPLYKRILEFWEAVTAILDCPGLCRDRRLRDQIASANDSVEANMHEGFEQPTDAAFAHYVFVAKGSTAEVLARLHEAQRKGYIAEEQLTPIVGLGESLGRMMGGFIKYLCASGFTDRGRHTVAPRSPSPVRPRPRRP